MNDKQHSGTGNWRALDRDTRAATPSGATHPDAHTHLQGDAHTDTHTHTCRGSHTYTPAGSHTLIHLHTCFPHFQSGPLMTLAPTPSIMYLVFLPALVPAASMARHTRQEQQLARDTRHTAALLTPSCLPHCLPRPPCQMNDARPSCGTRNNQGRRCVFNALKHSSVAFFTILFMCVTTRAPGGKSPNIMQ